MAKKAVPASVIQPVRVSPADQERYHAAAAKLGVTLSDEARRAWERMARRAERVHGGPITSPSGRHDV